MESKCDLNLLVANSNTGLIIQTLTKSKDKTQRERILRNHMASHMIAAWEGRWKGPEIPHDSLHVLLLVDEDYWMQRSNCWNKGEARVQVSACARVPSKVAKELKEVSNDQSANAV